MRFGGVSMQKKLAGDAAFDLKERPFAAAFFDGFDAIDRARQVSKAI